MARESREEPKSSDLVFFGKNRCKVTNSWIQSNSALSITDIWGVKQQTEDFFVSPFSLELIFRFKKMKKKNHEVGMVAWWVKPLPTWPTSHIGSGSYSIAPLWSRFLTTTMSQVFGSLLPMWKTNKKLLVPEFSLAQMQLLHLIWIMNQRLGELPVYLSTTLSGK